MIQLTNQNIAEKIEGLLKQTIENEGGYGKLFEEELPYMYIEIVCNNVKNEMIRKLFGISDNNDWDGVISRLDVKNQDFLQRKVIEYSLSQTLNHNDYFIRVSGYEKKQWVS